VLLGFKLVENVTFGAILKVVLQCHGLVLTNSTVLIGDDLKIVVLVCATELRIDVHYTL
jgi:hypothetical protein